MYSITIGEQILKRYKLQWYSHNGQRYYVKKTRILHSTSLQGVVHKALSLFRDEDRMPDNIQRI